LEARIEELIAPFSRQVEQLAEITGIARIGAAELIGVDMTRFPSAAHLVSWAKFAPRGPRVASAPAIPCRPRPGLALIRARRMIARPADGDA
jgi:Transposase IS116/IS110/IS902 family